MGAFLPSNPHHCKEEEGNLLSCDFVALSADEGTGDEFSLQHMALACFGSYQRFLFYRVGRMGISLLVIFKELLY